MVKMKKRTYIVGSNFVNHEIMAETFYKIYKISDDILSRGLDMTKLKVVIPFHAEIRDDKIFSLFIYEVLQEISIRGKLGDETWSLVDRSDAFKYEKFAQINQKIWEKIDIPSRNISEYADLYRKYKDSFIKSEKLEIQDDVRSFIEDVERHLEQYYSPLYDSLLRKKYGVAIDGTMCQYFQTDEYVKIEDLPVEVKQNIFGLKTITVNSTEFLDGCYAFVFRVKKGDTFELGLKRVKNFRNIKEIICDDDWQLGIPRKIPSMFPGPNEYEIFPHVYLTDITGKRLMGRFGFEGGKFIDKTRLWWQDNEMLENHSLYRDNGKKYGIETLFFITTRFGNIYRIMQFIVQLESYEAKFD